VTRANSRYAAMFDRCREEGQGAFGAFLMLGDPTPDQCADYLDALVEGGADMLELGIPFSDPVADGPVIQAASKRALDAGVRTADALELVAALRRRRPSIPIGILTYANIVAARGTAAFCGSLAEAGADSLLIADVPTLEAQPYSDAARQHGIDLVMIAATNTPGPAIERIAALSSGYTYCVARAGVTGSDERLSLSHGDLFAALAQAGAPPPVLGFGLSTPEQVAQAIAGGAAGAISGSAIVRMIADGEPPATLARFVAKLRTATKMA
jgi:tryptophan synthase alpha chain